MLNVVSAKLTGTPGAKGWSQVHEFEPDDPEKAKIRGKLYAVFATSQMEDGVDILTSGRELLARLHEEYFGNLEGEPFYALKKSVQKVSSEFSRNWGEVEIVVVAILPDVLYCAAVGGAGVTISRNGSMVKILESFPDRVVTASGFPKTGDTFLLATKEVFERLPSGVIKAALSAATPAESIEAIAPILHGSNGNGSMGAIVITFNDEIRLGARNFESVSAGTSKMVFSPAIAGKLSSMLSKVSRKLPAKSIYIRQNLNEEVSPQSKKVTFSVALILLFLLAVSIGFGVRQKKINDVKNKYQGILKDANSQIDQAISLASVSQDSSRELFNNALTKLTEIESMKVKDQAITELRQKVNDSRASVLGEYSADPQLFYDLGLLASGFSGQTAAFSAGQVYILDSSGNRVVSIDIETKKSKVVAGPSVINSAKSLACYEQKAFVLQNDGIYEVESGNQKLIDKTWAGEAFITAFAGNIYVLDKSGNSIYRYQGQGSRFGDKQNWLAGGTSVSFSDAMQMSIDGAVYVLYPNAKIIKFSQGSPQGFNLRGVVPEIGNIDALSASPDNEFIYLLDRVGKRIVVTDKKGAYKAQYISDSIAQAVTLVVSENDKKIILLTGDKLYSIELKN